MSKASVTSCLAGFRFIDAGLHPLATRGSLLSASGPGSRLELPACRQLGILIRSRYQSHIRLAHEFSCRKHGVPSGSRRTFRISGPGLWIDCAQHWSTLPGEPRATGTDGALASCRPAGNSNQHLERTFFRKNYWLKPSILEIRGFTTAFS